ncbi:hypothetical protein [Pandoraea apista]|uniref:Morphogenetic protein n=1 Tax=Pandoraea apista TaxID=93218 RepID=A0ABX9ZH77_9BURK|nr:hypothetical protein [Pandoraea apista]PTE02676.1 hypothetical protein C7830_00160 [Pandoraea apista]RRJ27545.1 hypothetical protein EIB05_21535 [Pandoraea apista]RRJ73164.1 hypothetical protein EIL82_22030 [Pandoraea apista]RSD06475.1 hypothetical protein EJB12_21620 [Pandoraea apista]RSD11282.1 hypothetical protein EIZ52_21525 [Pandoraea apista]
MKERPILFSAPMVRAILDGSKTQTRRLVKEWIGKPGNKPTPADVHYLPDFTCYRANCPYGQPGDRLWVRETWAQPTTLDPGPTFYRADYPRCVPPQYENVPLVDAITWKPSIHMPRSQCRLVLEVTGLRVERLNHISESDARAEGVDHIRDKVPTARDSFRYLWETLYGAESWTANPWVWVVEFKRGDGAKGA